MSFRLNFDLSLSFPSPSPRSDDDMQNHPPPTTTTQAQDQEDDRRRRRRPQGWWRTARQHPHFVLRVIYLVTTLMGLTLDTVLLSSIGYSYCAVLSLHQTALMPLTIGFLWQTLLLFHTRLFPRHRTKSIPNWLIALAETLGYLTFLALLVGNGLAIGEDSGGGDTFTLWQIMLITYDSAMWVALCLLNFTLAAQSYAQGWRNVRPKQRAGACENCGTGKGKRPAATRDEEEALLGDVVEEHVKEGEAGPSRGQGIVVSEERYNDEAHDREGGGRGG